jgi:nucleoporin p58/p45
MCSSDSAYSSIWLLLASQLTKCQDLSATTNTLVSDDLFAKDLRSKIDQAVQDVIIASRIVDGFKDGQQNAHLKNHAQFPLE